jgi:hypothetical protein
VSAAIVVLVALVLLYVTNTATAKHARARGIRVAQRIVSTHAHRAAGRTMAARRAGRVLEADLERAAMSELLDVETELLRIERGEA